MADEPKYHIVLLPREDYWNWVNAIREYAAHFGVSVTPSPENAVQFHKPEQTISVVYFQGAYPQYGDIVNWLKDQAPGVPLDVLAASSPEQLRQIAIERMASGLQLGKAPATAQGTPPQKKEFCLLWPTDYPVMIQGFDANAALYRRWNLPGHEGIDFKAPINSNIYACADGEVYLVHDGRGKHSYGIHVRILHRDGYRTIYAHLNQALVHTGQVVKAGDLIGLSNGTGNSAGSRLHLTLKKDGATAAGQTKYPYDIIDPTSFLTPAANRQPVGLPTGTWPYDHCLVGLHGRVDGPMQEADWEVVQAARIEAIKFTSSATSVDLERARALNPAMFILVRLAASFQNRALQPSDFARLVEYDLGLAYEQGVRYFEVHTEPNVVSEGYGASWRDGHEFGEWFLQVAGILKPRFPEAKLGWPGLSPGPTVEGVRVDHREFLGSAESAIIHADWIGCHCYWQNETDMLSEQGGLGYQLYRYAWPDKLLLITEFSNIAPSIGGYVKGNQYLKYYRHLRDQPGIGAAFAFAASASSSYPGEVWRSENGQPVPIAGIVGARSF